MILIFCFSAIAVGRCVANHFGYENLTVSNVFNSSSNDLEDGDIFLNATLLEKSVLNRAGSSLRMKSISQKLDAQHCLTFTVLGGSVSCGDGKSTTHPSRESNGKSGAWPAFFEKLINDRFPCYSTNNGSNVHEVLNLCEVAKGSDHWIQLFARKKDANDSFKFWSAVNRTNIFLIDTSLNDLFGKGYTLGVPNANRTMMQTEILIRLILMIEQAPAVLYLGASSQSHCEESKGCTDWGWEGQARTDAVEHQLPIAKYYNVPFVSMIDALGPFTTKELLDFWLTVCKIDRRHLTVFGSKLLAALAVHFLAVHVNSFRHSLLDGNKPSLTADNIPPPLLVDDRTFSIYTKSEPIEIDPLSNYCKSNPSRCGFLMETSSFLLQEDVPGKPGLIAQDVGSAVDFFLHPKLLNERISFGLLRLSVLMSYRHMGTLHLFLRREVSTAIGCMREDFRSPSKSFPLLLADVSVDCLWGREISIAQTVDVSFNGSALLPDGNRKYCLRVRIEIIESTPPRANSKIKLFGFYIY